MSRAIWFTSLLLFGWTLSVRGDNAPPAAPPAPPVAKPKSDGRPVFTPEREAAALRFVSLNHAELSKVLEQLKTTKPAEYEAAVRQLFQTSEQLTRTKEQDPDRYAIELEGWKTKSRIQLLVARAGLSEDPGLDKQLRESLEKQADTRVSQLELERRRAAERIQKLDDQIAKAKSDRPAEVEKQMTSLMKNINKARNEFKKRDAKAADKKPVEKTP